MAFAAPPGRLCETSDFADPNRQPWALMRHFLAIDPAAAGRKASVRAPLGR
jgi:hypothetical protein